MTKQELVERLLIAVCAYDAAVTNSDDPEYDAGAELYNEITEIIEEDGEFV